MKKEYAREDVMGKSVIAFVATAVMVILTNAHLSASTQESNNATVNNATITGTSNITDWSCWTNDVSVETAPDSLATPIPELNSGVGMTTITVSVASIDCRPHRKLLKASEMPKHMRKALKYNKQKRPSIIYQMESYTLGSNNKVVLHGNLTIAGVTRPQDVNATINPNGNNGIIVSGSADINMRDFDIEPPSRMMGMIVTNPNIQITLSVVVRI